MRPWSITCLALALLAGACSSGGDEPTAATAAPSATATTATTEVDPVDGGDGSVEAGTGEAELAAIVSSGWDSIWAGDFEAVLSLYDESCRAQLTIADFDATLGQGLIFLEQAGVDLAEIDVEVRIENFEDGASADAVSTILFPGDDPDEQDPQRWVVEDARWARADCGELVGAASGASTSTPVLTREIGSVADPADVGGVFPFQDWRAAIVSIEDAAGWASASAGDPPEGFTWQLVIYEGQYFGDAIAELEPFVVYAVGSAEYTSFDNDCLLDIEALGEAGIQSIASANPGSIIRSAVCLEIPTTELDTVTYTLSNAFSVDADAVYVPGGSEAPSLPPATPPVVDLSVGSVPFGTAVEFDADFTATVVDVIDGVASGLMSDFAGSPPTGFTHAVILYEATYSGRDETTLDPFLAEALGSGVYSTINSTCVVDTAAAIDQLGVAEGLDVAPGVPHRETSCVTAPVSELDDLVIRLEHVFSPTAEPATFSR